MKCTMPAHTQTRTPNAKNILGLTLVVWVKCVIQLQHSLIIWTWRIPIQWWWWFYMKFKCSLLAYVAEVTDLNYDWFTVHFTFWKNLFQSEMSQCCCFDSAIKTHSTFCSLPLFFSAHLTQSSLPCNTF